MCGQLVLSLSMWEWQWPGLEAPLAYCGTSWPLPVLPMHRYHSQVSPVLPLGET